MITSIYYYNANTPPKPIQVIQHSVFVHTYFIALLNVVLCSEIYEHG
jgi:hypothetical protein